MPGEKTPGPSIKWPSLYEKLIAEGHSKESAARISNAAWKRRKAGKLRKHRPGGQEHDQSDHGRWSRGVSAAQVEQRTEEQGGSTQRLATGVQPKRGFAVALSEFSSGALKNPTFRTFQEYMRKNAAELAKPGRHLGTWLDEATGEVWLDVVEVFDGDNYVNAFEQAADFAFNKQNEIAIFDLLNGPLNDYEDIRVDQVPEYRRRLSPDGRLAAREAA